MRRYKKTTTEIYPIAIDFDGQLPGSATIASCTVSATRQSDGVVDNTVLNSTTAVTTSTTAQVGVIAGTHGERYTIKFRATLSTGDEIDDAVEMKVEN